MTSGGKVSLPLISIILPCRNELGNILPLVGDIRRCLRGRRYEIVVVDDGEDGSGRALADMGYEELRVIAGPREGLARAVRQGVESSSGEGIIVMDSDFDHHPELLLVLIDGLWRFPCVSVSRFLSAAPRPLRYSLSRLFQSASRRKLGINVSDCLYGYFGVRRQVLNRMPFDEIFLGNGDYTMRFFHHLRRMDVPVREIPSIFSRRREGRGNTQWLKTLTGYWRTVLEIEQFSRGRAYVQ